MADPEQYDAALAAEYDRARRDHPLNSLPHGGWLKELGDIAGLRILDLACGSGHSTRLLAERGATVTGVDISLPMLMRAREEERRNPRGITYVHSDVADLELGEQFNTVTPSFLYHYADTRAKLTRLVEVTASHLIPGGRMVGLITPPDPIIPRMKNASHWTEWVDPDCAYTEGTGVRLHLVDVNGYEICHFSYTYWNQETYETALHAGGFTDVRWIPHRIPDALRQRYANWRELEAHNASIVIAATKSS